MQYIRTHLHTISVGIAVGCLLLIVPALLMRVYVARHLYRADETIPHADAILIPGASVVKNEPSEMLAARADLAIALYQAGVAKKIIVSGDNGEVEYDEVTPVRTYLIAHKIPARDIFLDHSGFDTFSSMYRARAIFGARSLVVVTQDFHLPRAVFLARMFGIDASGVVAQKGDSLFLYLREIPASWKALYDVLMGRQPKYLGAPIPLVGDGSITVQSVDNFAPSHTI